MSRPRPQHITLACAFAIALLSGCAVGPDYVRPEVATPEKFKEAPANGKWVQLDSASQQTPVVDEQWWRVFKDPVLDALQEQVSINNQNILIAEAQYRAARAALDSANACLLYTSPSPRDGLLSRMPSSA